MSKVLLVDDDRTMCSLVKTLLSLEGYSVVIAPTNLEEQEILEFVIREKPEYILMDVHLRGLNGLDILRRLKQTSPIFTGKIILVSGIDYHDKAYEAGAAGFLIKPYMPSDLLELLKK
ncbi:MAG TPA: response regulator [Anaerolineaceae bacterium]